MNTAANEMNPNEVAEQLGMIKNTFISKSVAALESGEVVDRWSLINDPKAIDDALDKNHQFGGPFHRRHHHGPERCHPVGRTRNQKATYDAVADSIANELRNMGIQVTSESSPLMVNRVPKPVPNLQGEAGRRRCRAVGYGQQGRRVHQHRRKELVPVEEHPYKREVQDRDRGGQVLQPIQNPE